MTQYIEVFDFNNIQFQDSSVSSHNLDSIQKKNCELVCEIAGSCDTHLDVRRDTFLK